MKRILIMILVLFAFQGYSQSLKDLSIRNTLTIKDSTVVGSYSGFLADTNKVIQLISVTTPAAAGNENEIQLNRSGVLGTSSNFSFDNNIFKLVSDSGVNNIFIGELSGASTLSGAEDNIFIGYNSGTVNLEGDENTIIGSNSGILTTGSENVFLGESSGNKNTTGLRNVYIGTKAGFNGATNSSNIFIGRYAGFNEIGSNKLILETTYTGADNENNALIYGEFDNDFVQINGTLKAQDDTLEVTADTTFIRNKLKVTDGVIYLNGRVITPACASAYIAEGDEAATTISSADTYYFLKGSFTNVDACDFGLDGDTLQYIGEQDISLTLHYSCTFSVGQVNTIVTTGVSVNDVVLGQSENDRKISATSDKGSWSGLASVNLETNDKIKILVKSDKTGTVTADRFSTILE